jgi:hypothetical protein
MTEDVMTAKAEQKSFDQPDETRDFPYGALRLLSIGGADIGRNYARSDG